MIPGVILGVPDEFSQNEDQSDSKCSINLEESGYSPLECSDFLFKKRLSTSARWISVGSLKCQNIYRSVLQQDTFILSICNFKKFKKISHLASSSSLSDFVQATIVSPSVTKTDKKRFQWIWTLNSLQSTTIQSTSDTHSARLPGL